MKFVKTFLLCFCFSIIFSSMLNASSLEIERLNHTNDFIYIDDDSQMYIKLINDYFPFEYKLDYVDFEVAESKDNIKLIIKDLNCGEILETLGESIQQRLTRNVSSATVYRDRNDSGANSRLQAVLEVWSSGSFFQINSVTDTHWRAMTGDNWKHNNTWANTRSMSGSYPATQVQIIGDAIIEFPTTNSTTGSFSINVLNSAGFTIGHSSGTTYIARKSIEMSFICGR